MEVKKNFKCYARFFYTKKLDKETAFNTVLKKA
jgi:hypothetical protein